ncbi:MAG: hypothetical protein CVV44_21805 [Spirochaetae bacterium HGW-Spirochaetae-1]|jgi:hypothetical protein|nr:MAG: hypothetical protein CVV44_21805 [Spirochaetae bacterium HGW-Spirochaetae-1]
MFWKNEWKPLFWIGAFFAALYYMPVGVPRFDNAVFEALHLAKWYAQEHVLLCLVPAFFIAGAIATFVRQEAVMKYLGPAANKVLAYGVGSVSGSILAVCSCTVLPLFSGIYRMGAGLGPAIAFLYSGPAINVLAIILTARVIGVDIGIARAVGAILFSVVIGGIMHFIYRNEEKQKVNATMNMPAAETKRPLWKDTIYFASMVAILVFANWGKSDDTSGFFYLVYSYKWIITAVSGAAFALFLVLWYDVKWWKMTPVVLIVAALSFLFGEYPIVPFSAGALGLAIITSTDTGEPGEWFTSTWDFAKQITPLLLGGVLISGFLLGRPGNEGVIPAAWVQWAVGGNSLAANFFASVVGAFMYFATLTEVPIVQALLGSGMGKGPALSLLLAGPALSLPNMLVIRSYIGTQKTIVYCLLVVVMATISGMIFGMFF